MTLAGYSRVPQINESVRLGVAQGIGFFEQPIREPFDIHPGMNFDEEPGPGREKGLAHPSRDTEFGGFDVSFNKIRRRQLTERNHAIK
jgi:hypothetical protein